MMSADPHMCRVCGGPFSQKRVWIDGNQYHERCAVMSYPPHTHADHSNLSDDLSRLMGAVQELRSVWFSGADIDHRAVAAECLKLFAAANAITSKYVGDVRGAE